VTWSATPRAAGAKAICPDPLPHRPFTCWAAASILAGLRGPGSVAFEAVPVAGPAPESWPSGRRRTPAKGVWVKSPSRVRIPHSPPYTNEKAPLRGGFFICIGLEFGMHGHRPPEGRGTWTCRVPSLTLPQQFVTNRSPFLAPVAFGNLFVTFAACFISLLTSSAIKHSISLSSSSHLNLSGNLSVDALLAPKQIRHARQMPPAYNRETFARKLRAR
jgi:hypothetical protein